MISYLAFPSCMLWFIAYTTIASLNLRLQLKKGKRKKERLIQEKLFEAEIRLMNVHYNYLLYYFFAANILLLYGFPKGNGTDLRDYLWRLIVILGNFEKKSFLGSILRHNIRWLISNTFKWLKVRLYQISDGTGCISH